MLDALAVLKRDGLTVSLTVVGDGTDRSRYEQRTQDLNLSQDVRFVGRLVELERDALLRRAGAAILYPTTANHAFPTVMLEPGPRERPLLRLRLGRCHHW